jgi:hypothetical protein
MLPVRLVPERLSTCPIHDRELRIGGEELHRLFLCLLRAPQLRQTCSQDAPRAKPVGRFMPKRFDGIGILARGVLGKPEKPIVPAGRMRIEAKGIAQVLDALALPPFECLQLPEERPGIGVIGVYSKRRRQFTRAFIRLA